MALTEERRDTCPSCGLLKVVCRDQARQFDFVVTEEQCHATKALADHQEATKERSAATQKAVQVAVTFREGAYPPLDVGLGLSDGDRESDADNDSQNDQAGQEPQ